MAFRRTILKQHLVKKLYPDSISVKAALQQLRREIEVCPTLREQIAQAGHTKRHYYNRQQLILILEHFCIALEEFEEL
jgi:predicted regulator of amino acid metabolism with ACT domain